VLYQVIKRKKTLMISDADTEETNRELASTLKVHGISSVLCVPMISDAQVVGALYVHSLHKPYGFMPEDACLFEEIAKRTDNFVRYGQYLSELSKMMEKQSAEN
jgi:GAF domain-containing protein